jgi:transcriptional regulator with XRE-family HTH domain
MDIGKNIREAREAQNLLVSEVARRAKLTVSGVQFVEEGRVRNPSVSTVIKIARALGVDPGELLKEAADEAVPKVVALPSTPLVDTAPKDLDERLRSSSSAATTEAILRGIEAEENALLELMARHVSPKLDRARLYRMAATDRWVKQADKSRDPSEAANQFKSVSDIAREVKDAQEWLKDQKDNASQQEAPTSAAELR